MANQYTYPAQRRVTDGRTVDAARLNDTLIELSLASRELRDGKINTTGSVTLSAGATTTVVAHSAMDAFRWVGVTPTSAAAAALAPFVSVKASASFTIGHGAAAGTEILDWVILG